MSAQKWVSPAGAPLTATLTATGPAGGATYSKQYGASGDLNVGTAIELFAAGEVTTTGTPAITVGVAGFSAESTVAITTAADLSAATWKCAAAFTVRSINADDTIDYSYWYQIDGLTADPVTGSGIAAGASYDAFLSVRVQWDTADSGDEITLTQAYGKWIG